jgi:3-oxoacyl-[acyl-carrier protein] reductase
MAEGKKAIVTGGTRGIGRAIVETLAANGYDVAFNYLSNEQMAAEIVSSINAKSSGKAFAFRADITDFAEAAGFISSAKEALGGDVDALVNNAGITRDKSLFIMPEADWDAVLNTNLKGYFNVTRNIVGYFMKLKKGTIVNVTSVSGMVGMPGQTNYCASKAGIIGFTRALAKEIAKLAIPVNCVAPGFIETDMTARLDPEHLKEVTKQVPMRRLGTAAEVAELVAWLVCRAPRYITGQTFVIDGGLTA